MPSKGIEFFSFISHPSPITISVSIPGQSITITDKHVFRTDALEIEASAVRWPLHRTGRLEFVVRRDGHALTSQHIDVDPVTGRVAEGSSMDDLLNETRSIVHPDLIISYGMYAAGPGYAGLPDRHQVYAVVTPNWSAWQHDVAPPGSAEAHKPFNHLVLPAAHDVGMNTLEPITAILKHAGAAAARVVTAAMPTSLFRGAEPALVRLLSGASDATAAKITPDIVASLAVTQKDTVATLCALGARYFEFRPAHCHAQLLPHSPLENKLYFQHGPVPGMGYDDFLLELVRFLATNGDEIAVVHVRWDGVPGECARPDEGELGRYLDAALALAGGGLTAGNLDDLRGRTMHDLRAAGKRLLMLINEPDVLSTYDDVANASVDGTLILAAFERVLEARNQEGRCLTLAQCQATPTNIADVVHYSIATAEASSLVLMATKARCTSLMLPWAAEHVTGRCRRDQTVVLMDDFLDGSTADVAVKLSRERLRG